MKKIMYVTTEKAAEYLGLGSQTLVNWRNLKKGPRYVKLSARAIRYNIEDLEAYMTKHLVDNMK